MFIAKFSDGTKVTFVRLHLKLKGVTSSTYLALCEQCCALMATFWKQLDNLQQHNSPKSMKKHVAAWRAVIGWGWSDEEVEHCDISDDLWHPPGTPLVFIGHIHHALWPANWTRVVCSLWDHSVGTWCVCSQIRSFYSEAFLRGRRKTFWQWLQLIPIRPELRRNNKTIWQFLVPVGTTT